MPQTIGIANPTLTSSQLVPASPGFLMASKSRAIDNRANLFPANDVIDLPNIPVGAQSAIIIVEAATSAKVLARFFQDGTHPDTGYGMPIYDGAPIEIVGMDNLANTRLISADGGAHQLNVQYFC